MSYLFGFSDYAPFFKVGSGLHFLFVNIIIYNLYTFFSLLKLAHNVLRAGDRNPVLRLRQGYGACTLLRAGYFNNSQKLIIYRTKNAEAFF
jgi:hypothetical protein